MSNDTRRIVYRTASGEIASFDTNVVGDCRSVAVDIEPVQAGSGDPSPDNVRPISGRDAVTVTRTGVNVWDEQWVQGSIDNSTGEDRVAGTGIRCIGYIPVVPNDSYYVYVGDANSVQYYWYDSEKTFLSSAGVRNSVLQVPSNARYLRIRSTGDYGDVYNHDISINYPATDTQYHPYQGETYDIEFPSEAGTVYGGTLDVVNGKLAVDRAIDSAKWSTFGSKTSLGSFTRGYINLSNTPVDVNPTDLCNVAPFDYSYGAWTSDTLHFYVNGSNSRAFVWLPNDTDGGLTVSVCYKLATPIEIPLTPQQMTTLLGTNNIWSDAGDVTVEYPYNDTSKNADFLRLLFIESMWGGEDV